MATEYFTIVQGGRHVGVGHVDTETGIGTINLIGSGVYRIAGEIAQDGNHDRLPGPGCNQPPVSESTDEELPF